MKLARRVLPLILCLFMLIPAMKASATDAKVVFSATTPDTNGLFTVSVTAYNATFDTFQYSFNFDQSVVTTASWSTGAAATDFDSFAKISADFSDAMYEGYMPKNSGLINTVGLNATKTYTAGADGLLIFSYRFKKLTDSDAGIGLATSDTGKKYNSALPTGGKLLCNDALVAASYAFNLPAALTGGKGDTQQTATTVMTKAERAKNTIILQIGNYAATKDGALCHIYSGEKQITPYIKTDDTGNGRTMVPIRFIAERLGATIGWDDAAKTITIKMNGNTVVMTIGSSSYSVNGVSKTMDTVAELKDSGDGNSRTMVPMRFVAEALGKSAFWDSNNKLVIITSADAPWQADRSAEKDLTSDVLLIISPLLRDTVQ